MIDSINAILNVVAFSISALVQVHWARWAWRSRRRYSTTARLALLGLVVACIYYSLVYIPVSLGLVDTATFGPVWIRRVLWGFAVVCLVAAKAIHLLIKTREEQEASRAREDELRTLVDGLQNEIADIVTVVSHEIRTPLSLIDGYVQLLRGGDIYGALTPQQLDGLAGAGRGLDRLMYVVNRALVVRQTLQLEVFDVARLVRSILADERIWSTTRRSRTDNNIILAYDESTPPIAIEADRSKIKVLMTELIVNAIKFSNIGGEITVGTWVEGDDFVFSVRDEGIGIDLHKYESIIFRPGTQIRSSHMTREYEGTGYGLAVVHALVVAHGGIIEIESELGVGSTFTVRIPL